MSVDCGHRNAQQHSPSNSQPAAHDYANVTPNQTRSDDETPYEDIALDHRTHGPDADNYASLNSQTRGEQPQYDVISRPQKDKDAPVYVNMK